MSERIPTAEDIRLALIEVGYTHYEADDAIEAVKRRTAHDRAVTLLDTKKTHERAIDELRHDLKVALAEVADLGDENDRLERILQSPLSLKDLEVAWEAAAVPTADAPIREGDVVIAFNETNLWGYSVRRAHPIDFELGAKGYVRVLSRAPKREPWADLADVLGGFAIHDTDGKEYPDVLARKLYERGVRLTGGGDDE